MTERLSAGLRACATKARARNHVLVLGDWSFAASGFALEHFDTAPVVNLWDGLTTEAKDELARLRLGQGSEPVHGPTPRGGRTRNLPTHHAD